MNTHHRFYVLTRHKMGISGKYMFAELSLTNKDTCPSLHTIWRCIAEIKKGCFELSKGKSPGRPVSTSAGPNIQKVKGLLKKTAVCRTPSLKLSQKYPSQLFTKFWEAILTLEMSIQFGFLTSSLTTIKQQEFRPAIKQFLDLRGVPLVSQSLYTVQSWPKPSGPISVPAHQNGP